MLEKQLPQKEEVVFTDVLTPLERFQHFIYRAQLQMNVTDRRLLVKVGDAVSILVAGLVGYSLWEVANFGAIQAGHFSQHGIVILITGALWLLLATANDFYDSEALVELNNMMRTLVSVNIQMLFLVLVVYFLLPPSFIPREPILVHGVISFTLIAIWRLTTVEVIARTFEPQRVLVVGCDQRVNRLIELINTKHSKVYKTLGVVCDDHEGCKHDLPDLGMLENLPILVDRLKITELVLTSKVMQNAAAHRLILDQYEKGVGFITVPHLFERLSGQTPVEYIGDTWYSILATGVNSDFNNWYYRVAKRMGDIIFALVGLIVFAVFFPFLALAIKLDSKGSIFYSQERVGLHGKTFKIYKSRSMVANAERDTGAVFAQANDARVTRVGRFLRKSRLDEFPQLYNVLVGDMSLIGPRPERELHVRRLAEKIPFYRARLVVRPGLTGWAQVRYGYGANDEDAQKKLEYDLYYIRNASLPLDVTILVRTVYKVLSLSGQ